MVTSGGIVVVLGEAGEGPGAGLAAAVGAGGVGPGLGVEALAAAAADAGADAHPPRLTLHQFRSGCQCKRCYREVLTISQSHSPHGCQGPHWPRPPPLPTTGSWNRQDRERKGSAEVTVWVWHCPAPFTRRLPAVRARAPLLRFVTHAHAAESVLALTVAARKGGAVIACLVVR